ncbi:MAG: SAM-dependent methyltransferase [Gammaproteobacteria bacterium]
MIGAGIDIHIAGLGVQGVDHLTLETDAILAECNEVLYVDTGIATRAYLAARCRRATALYDESYAPGRGRVGAYRHMAARVVEAALDHPPVAFAMFGHPIVFAYAPFLIADMARLLDLRVQVLPAVSSLDCLFAAQMLDPSVSGLLIYEATDLLLRRRPLMPDVPTLIWQVGNLETRLHSLRPGAPGRLFRFVRYLLEAYPPDHELIAYYAAPHALLRSTSLRITLADLPEHVHALHAGVTLLVPPARIRPIADADLLARLDDPAHLDRITR